MNMATLIRKLVFVAIALAQPALADAVAAQESATCGDECGMVSLLQTGLKLREEHVETQAVSQASPSGETQTHDQSFKQRGPSPALASAPSLHIVSVTYTKGAEYAARVQNEVLARMPSDATYSTVCDVDCARLAGDKLHNVVEMDDSAFPSGSCRYKGADCSGYRRAQMKFFFGLRHEVQTREAKGLPMPRWVLVKDDDTYVNAKRLLAKLDADDRVGNPLLEPVSLAELATKLESAIDPRASKLPLPPLVAHGGGGWLLSGELARRLGTEAGGDECIKTVEAHLANDPSAGEYKPEVKFLGKALEDPGSFCYDVWVPYCVNLVSGTVVNSTLLSAEANPLKALLGEADPLKALFGAAVNSTALSAEANPLKALLGDHPLKTLKALGPQKTLEALFGEADPLGLRHAMLSSCPPRGTVSIHLQWKRFALGDEEALAWAVRCFEERSVELAS